MDDAELLTNARSGNREALDQLLAGARPGAIRFAAAMLGNEDEAEDVFQTACRAVQEEIGKFEGRSTFSTWLYGIVLNQTRRILRNRARHARPADPEGLDDRQRGHGVLSSIYRRELSANLDHAVQELPQTLKEAFVLRYLEGLGYDQIATITGVSVNTLYVRAHRAKELLKASLGSVVDSFWTQESDRKD